jgi:Prokaryotic E2 family E
MTPEVAAAVQEIKHAFPDRRVEVFPEEQGGAYVIVPDLDLGARYTPSTSWCGFLITFQYPRADVYPHFLDGSVRRSDGGGFPAGITGPTTWQDRQALQVSRRSNRWNPALDTALTKLVKVLEWVRSQ